jgi:hypothetical protein
MLSRVGSWQVFEASNDDVSPLLGETAQDRVSMGCVSRVHLLAQRFAYFFALSR